MSIFLYSSALKLINVAKVSLFFEIQRKRTKLIRKRGKLITGGRGDLRGARQISLFRQIPHSERSEESPAVHNDRGRMRQFEMPPDKLAQNRQVRTLLNADHVKMFYAI